MDREVKRTSPKVTFTQSTSTNSLPPCVALVASGRATDGPDGFRTDWRPPTFKAYSYCGILKNRTRNASLLIAAGLQLGPLLKMQPVHDGWTQM